MAGRRGLVLGGSLVFVLLGGTGAQAVVVPRCVIVPTVALPHAVHRGTQAVAPSQVDPQTIEVTVPKVVCRPDPTKPISGNGGGNGSSGDGGGGGKGLPFTGFDLEHALSDGLLLLVIGTMAMYAGASLEPLRPSRQGVAGEGG